MITNLLRLLILTAIAALSFNSEAKFKVTDLSLEYLYSVGTNRHWAIPDDEEKEGELNLRMAHESEYFFSRTRIGMMYTNKQFRYGALEYEVGAKVTGFEFFFNHISEHTLDFERSVKYQNQNSVGVRIDLR